MTVFRSWRREGSEGAYRALSAEMEAAARSVPGFVDFKTFTADDGEHVSLVTFASAGGPPGLAERPPPPPRPEAGTGRVLLRVQHPGGGVHPRVAVEPGRPLNPPMVSPSRLG